MRPIGLSLIPGEAVIMRARDMEKVSVARPVELLWSFRQPSGFVVQRPRDKGLAFLGDDRVTRVGRPGVVSHHERPFGYLVTRVRSQAARRRRDWSARLRVVVVVVPGGCQLPDREGWLHRR